MNSIKIFFGFLAIVSFFPMSSFAETAVLCSSQSNFKSMVADPSNNKIKAFHVVFSFEKVTSAKDVKFFQSFDKYLKVLKAQRLGKYVDMTASDGSTSMKFKLEFLDRGFCDAESVAVILHNQREKLPCFCVED